jgi:hypothetical protein
LHFYNFLRTFAYHLQWLKNYQNPKIQIIMKKTLFFAAMLLGLASYAGA